MELIKRLKKYKEKDGLTNEQISMDMGVSVFLITRLLSKPPKRIHTTTRIVLEGYLKKKGII